MKWLMTYLGNVINTDNIISIEWKPFSSSDNSAEKFKEMIINSTTNSVVLATDVNNNEIILGEYTSDSLAQEEVISIVEWLYNQEDNEPFHVLCDEDMDMTKQIMEEE